MQEINVKDPKKVFIPARITLEETALVSKILCKNGEKVEQGQTIMEIETSKAIYEITAEYSDEVTILVQEGQVIDHSLPVAILGKNISSNDSISRKTSIKKIEFTEASVALLNKKNISIEQAETLFKDYSIVTSEMVTKKLSEDLSPVKDAIHINSTSITSLIVGFGHRGVLLCELLKELSPDKQFAYLDYLNKTNTVVTHLKSVAVHSIFNLSDYLENDFPKVTEIYWCAPVADSSNNLGLTFDKLASQIHSYLSPKAQVSQTATLGIGVICFPFSVIGPNSKLGKGVVVENMAILGTGATLGDFSCINNSASVAHGSIIGNSTSISDGARIAGNVKIGSNCLIGLNSTVNSGLTIGDNVTVNSGANVYNDVPANSIYTNNGDIISKQKI